MEDLVVDENNLDSEQLSITLLERRKRLHELATEINNWEDEAFNKNTNTNSNVLIKQARPSTPQASILLFNCQSPNKKQQVPPVPPLNNKENSPLNRNLNSTVTNTSSSKIRQSNSKSSLVQNIKNKFETMSIAALSNQDDVLTTGGDENAVPMTPKLIIQKFEAMLRDGMTLNGATQPTQQHNTSITQKPSSKQCLGNISNTSLNKLTPMSTSTLRLAQHDAIEAATPKSIIQKFEQLVKSNNQPVIPVPPPLPSTLSTVVSSKRSDNASLTFISSMQSPQSLSSDEQPIYNCLIEGENDDNNGNEEEEEEAVYEELGQFLKETTSLFEDSQQENSDITSSCVTQPDGSNQETYSLSSSYTSSIINQEFADIVNENDDEEESSDLYEEATKTDSCCYTCNDDDEQEADNTYTLAKETKPITLSSGGTIVTSFPDTKDIDTATSECEPLFSIKEYRKQKKYGYSRRSSVAHAGAAANINKTGVNMKISSNIKTTTCTRLSGEPSSVEEQNKKAKYLERIKELEELIKQEDNVIYQTGIALERCLTDTQFTGSSEHIECNRILLISCQKRQAYLTEINRLKSLYTGKKQIGNNKNDEQFTDALFKDLSPADLTGLLIFSDIQLPIKESYLNKLKSGDEKRIFYFLCLIRNGIQVLQTQVISVQELIATRDTNITFPNRMAISNVDVNFKVKIDVYTLEMQPKEVKHSKQTSLASNATSKFFSPFKNAVFHHHSNNQSTGSVSSSSSSSSTHTNLTNANHHFNEQSNLGISSGGAKTSNFIHIDTVEITIKDLSNNRYKLNISSSSIPLTGTLFVNLRCMPSKSIELKGFMTLLEDVNGFRSWDRRWCFLNNYNISYWKYPEDEFRISPMGIINLTKCVNENVSLLPRDLCARKYTIELLISENDNEQENCANHKNESNIKCKRYRVSADNKEQANDWLTNINYALANLRLWNPKATKPRQ